MSKKESPSGLIKVPTRPKSAGIKKNGTQPGTKYGAGQPKGGK